MINIDFDKQSNNKIMSDDTVMESDDLADYMLNRLHIEESAESRQSLCDDLQQMINDNLETIEQLYQEIQYLKQTNLMFSMQIKENQK